MFIFSFQAVYLYSSLENKNHHDEEEEEEEEDASSGRVSATSTNESSQLEAVHNEINTPPIPMSATFSYPPPASKAPLPPASKAPLPPAEAGSSLVSNDNVIQEFNVRGLSEVDNEVTIVAVPHYPLKISASAPIVPSSLLEDNKAQGEDALYEDVFEGQNLRKCSTPPVPAPRKASLRKASSVKENPAINSDIASLIVNKNQHIEEKKKEEEKNGTTSNTKKHDYVNVKHNVERLKSAPIGSDTSPVYAEPMVTTNQRTRVMSCNPGISMTPPLSSRKKSIPARQRSVSGGDASPLARIISNARSLEGSSGSSPALDRIAENDEVTDVFSQPEEYLEPVFIKKKKT